MKTLAIGVLSLCVLAGSAAAQVRISQVYAGSGTVFDRDYVELYNAGSTEVNLGGWSVKYTNGTGLFWQVSALMGTIEPHGYFLFAMNSGSGGGAPLPPPDWEGFSSFDTGGGKMLLSGDSASLTARCPSLDSTVDMVLWGTIDCEGVTTAPAMDGTNAILRKNGGCQDTDDCGADFELGTPTPRNTSNTHSCIGGSDCNGNGVDDASEIATDPTLDCNGNGVLDSCEVSENPSLDCNGNGIIDCTDLRTGVLTDVNGNGVPDSCEGAVVVAPVGAVTVVSTGVSTDTTAWRAQGTAVEDSDGRTNPSYGAARWSTGSITSALYSQVGGPWVINKIYLVTKQVNDGSGAPGGVQLFYTNHDSVSLTPGNTSTRFTTFATNFSDRVEITNWAFAPAPAGTSDVRLLYSSLGPNSGGQTSVDADIEGGVGVLTVLFYPTATTVLAPLAGIAHPTYAPPQLVIFASGLGCGNADFNGDGDTGTDADIEAFFACLAGDCCATCDPHGADFNGDGDVGTDADIESFFRVLAGGPC